GFENVRPRRSRVLDTISGGPWPADNWSARWRWPTQRLSGRAPEFPVAPAADVRYADPVFDGWTAHCFKRSGASAYSDERSFRASAGRDVGPARFGSARLKLGTNRAHVRDRVRPCADQHRAGRVPGVRGAASAIARCRSERLARLEGLGACAVQRERV